MMTDSPILTVTSNFVARLQDAEEQIAAGKTVPLTGLTDAELWAMWNKSIGTDYPLPETFGDDDD